MHTGPRWEPAGRRPLARSSCNGENVMGVNQIRQVWEIYCVGIRENYIYRPSPYRAVNTLRLGYTNQSVSAV